MAFLQEYTMLDELGKGGFATVYKVRHNELGYIRAVRVLNETIVAKEGDNPKRSEAYQKFLAECKVLLRLGNGNHPNIVHIYKPDLLDNKALVEMDYVDGQDILHYLKANQNCVPVEEVIRMALQISSALAYCHEDIYRFCMDRDEDKLQDDPNDGSKVLIDDKTRKKLISKYKVIHNDIHTGNIMRREDGNFVLLDFGLAINGNEIVRSSRHANGAPEFKSPEKWDNESILTEQSDIYSFGIVLYQMLAGRVPFPYNTSISTHRAEYELGEAHQKTPPPSIEEIRREYFERKHEGEKYEKDYPQWLEDVILKCLQKDSCDRFKNGRELLDFIQSQVQNSSDERLELEYLIDENKKQASEIIELQKECDFLSLELQNEKNENDNLKMKLNNCGNRKKSPLLIALIICFGLWGLGSVFYIYYTRKQLNFNTNIISPNSIVFEAAVQGEADAQFCLGICYLDGIGINNNDSIGMYWLRQAAEQGHAGAQFLYGNLNYDWRQIGDSVARLETFNWFQKAAEQGQVDAQIHLEKYHDSFDGMNVDGINVNGMNVSESIYGLRLAAEQGRNTADPYSIGFDGNSIAQGRLGYKYYSGQGVKQNYSIAAYWFQRAAENNISPNAVAMYYLAECYYYGKGVKTNYSQAMYWYKKSAKLGYAAAKEKL